MRDFELLLQSGVEHHRAGHFHEAELCYRQVISRAPEYAEAWHLLGLIAYEARQDAAAEELIRHGIQLQPISPSFHLSLATVLQRQGRYDEAIESLKLVARWEPHSVAAHNNLGEAYKIKGEIRKALDCYDAALQIREDFFTGRSNRLMVMHYDPHISRDEMLAAHRRWGELQRRHVQPRQHHSNQPDPMRQIRVGYVSPDFREHAVARFVAPLLQHYDRHSQQVFLYDAMPMDDATSGRFRAAVDGWRSIADLTTDEAAALVLKDEIDILVDLAGHSAHHRLDLFAAKPAPIQVTYLGYPDTTGVEAIDYRLSDELLDPAGEPSWSTEETLRIPGGFCCFEPPSHAPPISPLPVLSQGRITFGSHHATHKLNDEVFRCWLQIVSSIPQSRILFIRSTLRPPVVEQLRHRLVALGFRPDQIDFCRPIETQMSYLAPLADVDICLDSFPYTGHTTTCEALWMGVPVVSLYGDRPAGRASASIMHSLGIETLIAHSRDEYCDLAVRLAQDTPQLVRWRNELRPRMADSVCHGPDFCRRLEATFRQMWQRWCQQAQSVHNRE